MNPFNFKKSSYGYEWKIITQYFKFPKRKKKRKKRKVVHKPAIVKKYSKRFEILDETI